MSLITRNGVYYDLTMSPYKIKCGELTFVFSSKLHLDKFKNKVKENRSIINYSLTKRFNIEVDVSSLADVILYRKIEGRGYLILNDEGQELCRENHKFVGGRMTFKNSNEQ